MVDTPIGTNSANYTLQPTDVGATVFCRVTATNASGSAQAFSNVVGPVVAATGVPSNTTAPAIVAPTPHVGDTLNVSDGIWTGSPTGYTYQWKRGVTDVGISSASYLLVTADLAANMSCVVTATNASGSANATSNVVGPVAAASAGGSTWNPADKTTNMELGGGNLTASVDTDAGFTQQYVRGTTSQSTGKKYFEITLTTIGNSATPDLVLFAGLVDGTHTLGSGRPGTLDSKGFNTQLYSTNTAIEAQTGGIYYYPAVAVTVAAGDVIGFACDLGTHDVWIYKNGMVIRGSPVTPTDGANWGASAGAAMFPWVGMQWQGTITTGTVTLNTGGSAFTTSPLPTGYTAWG